jgi:hypothetical protein
MRTALLALAALLALGCERRAHPWDQSDAALPPPPPRSSSAPGPEAPDGATASHDAGDDDDAGLPASPVRVGGPWVSCYGHFRVSGDPVKDVTRLAILCGPENGMRRLSKKPLEGSVAEGGAAVTDTFEARRGECYRIFAVAEPSVADLDVTVRSSRGAAIAADHGEDGWPIVQPDRPFCPLEDDRYSVEISARRGRGRFAAEVWVLRTPGKRPD